MSQEEGMSQEVPQRAEAMSVEVQRVPEVSAQEDQKRQQLIEREKMLDQELAALPETKMLKAWEVRRFLMMKRSDPPVPSMTVQKLKEVIAEIKRTGEIPKALFIKGEEQEARAIYNSFFVGPWVQENVQLCTNRVHQLERQRDFFLGKRGIPFPEFARIQQEFESKINFERYQFWESTLPGIPALASLQKVMNSWMLHFSTGFINWSEPGGQHTHYMAQLRTNLPDKFFKLLPKECR